MEEFSKNGRKLRPRKTSTAAHPSSERVEMGERRSYGESRGTSEHRSYGEHKPYGERRNYGDRKPYGERRSFGDGGNTNGGERRSFGDRKPYGENRPHGEGRPYSDRKPYGERRSFGEGGSTNGGERRSFGDRKPYAEKRSFGENKPYGERRSFSGRPSRPGTRPSGDRPGRSRQAFRNEHTFSKASVEGIGRMISRRPVVDDPQIEPVEKFPIKFQEEVRLNKFIANSGVCSRREADTLIQAGVVTVNGEVVTELGVKVNVNTDDIRFNGERLKGEEKVYIVMNKPAGYVTTASDPHAEKTVLDLVKDCKYRVYPVGRLDKATTGVLMLTNDGEIAERLTHPSYDKKKIYQVALDRNLSEEDYAKVLAGVALTDGEVKADELEYIDENDHRKLGIEIHSGKNRVVRRIFETLGYNVKALDRVYFAGLTKKGLKKGTWRYLSESEVNILKMGAYA